MVWKKNEKEKAKAKRADVEMQNAEYESFSGVATYAGIKKPLPKKMQKVLFTTLSFFQMIWQESWSGLSCPPPGHLHDPGIKPMSLMSPALAGRFFTNSATQEAYK